MHDIMRVKRGGGACFRGSGGAAVTKALPMERTAGAARVTILKMALAAAGGRDKIDKALSASMGR